MGCVGGDHSEREVRVTLDLYSHLFSNMQEDAAAGLGKMFFDDDDDDDDNLKPSFTGFGFFFVLLTFYSPIDEYYLYEELLLPHQLNRKLKEPLHS
jgi:hypothetical protein